MKQTITDVMTPEQRSRCMAAVRGRDTKPEMLVRRYLHGRGLRFRVNVKRLPGSPDIVFRKYRTVLFVDGCFWHGHQGCRFFKLPQTNTDFWRQKINMNMARDYANTVDLRLAGWRVVRVWECELKPAATRQQVLDSIYRAVTAPIAPPRQAPPMAAEPQAPYGSR